MVTGQLKVIQDEFVGGQYDIFHSLKEIIIFVTHPEFIVPPHQDTVSYNFGIYARPFKQPDGAHKNKITPMLVYLSN